MHKLKIFRVANLIYDSLASSYSSSRLAQVYIETLSLNHADSVSLISYFV